jgi:DHA2 family multidrug resistance protein-like MFS transporter
MIVGALLAPLVARRVRPHTVVATGMASAAAGYALLTQIERDGGMVVLVAGIVVVFFGIGVMATLTQDLVLGAVPPQRAGSAAAISQTSGDLGVALGIALLGSAATAVYRTRLPADATANGTIADAVSAAGQLSPGSAMALPDAVYGTFTAAVHVVAGTSAVVAGALAALAAVMLRPHQTATTRGNHEDRSSSR